MLRSVDPQAPGATLVVALVIASLPTSQEQVDMEQPEHSAEIPLEVESLDEWTVTPSAFAAVTTETLPANISFPLIEEDGAQAEFMLMVLVPSILLALLLLSVVFLVIHRKRKRNKREPSSQGSHNALQTNELASENMKVPIFEEDTPSVMEIEMEELDKWMNSMNRNADYEGLPTLEEEKEPNHNSPSDNEA